MEDCCTDERLRQETLCHRQWTDEYVEHPCIDVDEAEVQEEWKYEVEGEQVPQCPIATDANVTDRMCAGSP